jgi:ParB family chromosome partitioning protein
VSRERRLGRGLEALLGRNLEGASGPGYREPSDQSEHTGLLAAEPASIADGQLTHSPDGQQWLPLNVIVANPYQPRTHFDEAEIADLCDSIRTHGFLQPILVRRADDGYQVIAGERRLRAAQMAGWERVPVQIREAADRQMAELAIVENVQRKDLNAIEKAASFKRYMDEYGCTQEDLAGRVNIDRSTVSNLLRLLELPSEIKSMVERGDITAGHAKALLPLGDEHEQLEFASEFKRNRCRYVRPKRPSPTTFAAPMTNPSRSSTPRATVVLRRCSPASTCAICRTSSAWLWARRSRSSSPPRAAAGSRSTSAATKNSTVCERC